MNLSDFSLSSLEGLEQQINPLSILGAAESQEFSDLLDLGFSLPVGSHFLDDFPVWDPRFAAPSVLRLGVFRQGRLISCAGIRIAQMKTSPTESLSIALIGAVATHPDFRGQGLASRCISYLVNWAKEQRAFCVILWSSQAELYLRQGFLDFGEQIRLPLGKLLDLFYDAGVKDKRREEEVSLGWKPSLFGKLQKRTSGLVLRDSDRIWFEAHRNVKWFSIGSSESPRAYAALGRGIDLQGIVHEWGGDRDSLFRIFQEIRTLDSEAVVLGSELLFREIGVSTEHGYREPLCMAKIFNQDLNKLLNLPMWIWGLDAA